jgi:hypothetical protein
MTDKPMTVGDVINRLVYESKGNRSIPVLCPHLDNRGLIYDDNVEFVDRLEYSDGSIQAIVIR